jgi:hypothetical protein
LIKLDRLSPLAKKMVFKTWRINFNNNLQPTKRLIMQLWINIATSNNIKQR